MFQGSSALALDAKGRMTVPTRHRDALSVQCEGRLTLTRSPDGCLLLFPRPVWEVHRERIAALMHPARVDLTDDLRALRPWGRRRFQRYEERHAYFEEIVRERLS